MRDPSWGAVFPLVAYNLWKHYNCTTCIDGAWDGLRRYHDLLVSNYTSGTAGGIQRTRAFWGDWNPAYPAPGRDPTGAGPRFTRTLSHITAATMVLQNLGDMTEMATATGRATATHAHLAGRRTHAKGLSATVKVMGPAIATRALPVLFFHHRRRRRRLLT